MNIMERGMRGPAVLKYLDGEYKVIAPGGFVICAVTGAQIPLEDLRATGVSICKKPIQALKSPIAAMRKR